MMPVLTEGPHKGEFIVSQGNGSISREVVTILSGRTLEPGTVLGQVTASGKYRDLDPALSNGAEIAAAILHDAVDASAGDVSAVAILRLAEINAAEIIWPDGITANQKQTALGQLAALNIIAR
jgi:hypothetical protein